MELQGAKYIQIQQLTMHMKKQIVAISLVVVPMAVHAQTAAKKPALQKKVQIAFSMKMLETKIPAGFAGVDLRKVCKTPPTTVGGIHSET